MILNRRRRQPRSPQPTERLRAITPYRVPRLLAPIDLALDGNEGPPPDAERLAVAARHLSAAINRYPATAALQQLWAKRLGVRPDRVRITAGADEAIDRVVRTFVGPGREMLTTAPTFEMFERYCALAGGRYVSVPWTEGTLPVEALLSRVTARTAVIAIATPNNPTGTTARSSELLALAAGAPGTVVLADLAYVEFADEDPTPALLDCPNVIVTRTMSKARGLAGLRVGCAAGPADLIGWLTAAGNPYPVSGLSISLAMASFEADEDRVGEAVAEVRIERDALARFLEPFALRVWPSQANFVLAEFRDAQWIWEALAGLGIGVRRFPGRPGLEQALRIGCPGNAGDFGRLQRGLEAALAPQALIFDMDGVLADVSASFDAAIVRTAASFGVSVEPSDVWEAKQAGRANNDWELTRRLMAARGADHPLEVVTERFEQIYQGSPEAPGLCNLEGTIPPRPLLDRLAARLPLGVVTGRPRRDALRFLERCGLAERFRVVVTMEDAPGKPDPAPVALALERLGVERAWLVGDTPDDVTAARAAGVVPIGVVAPGHPPDPMRRALTEAGAGRVLGNLAELEGLLR
ncbi:MAG TPA: TIGR01548 family HAD-type hydrolase [Vicinamibacterales bacterium]|nr:TIGR01548 family HAD-type hydrolase [Vicinamibacterales bacterium]